MFILDLLLLPLTLLEGIIFVLFLSAGCSTGTLCL